MRKFYLAMSSLVLVAVLAQFYFAAYGAFSIPREHASFTAHSITGMMVIPLASLLTTVVAALARVPGRLIGLAAAPFGLVAVQILIFVVVHLVTDMTMERSTPGAQLILGFHALNALGILAVSVLGVVRARRFVRGSGSGNGGRSPRSAPVSPAVAPARVDTKSTVSSGVTA